MRAPGLPAAWPEPSDWYGAAVAASRYTNPDAGVRRRALKILLVEDDAETAELRRGAA